MTLSVPMPTLLPSDQATVPQPAIIEEITPTAQDDITAMPDNDTQGHFNETAQNTESANTGNSGQN